MVLLYGSIATPTPARRAVEAMACAWPDLGEGRVQVLGPSIAVGAIGRPNDGGAEQAWRTEGPVTIAADMRLDNRAVLCARLGLDRSCPDLPLLHAAWRRWGRELVAELEGDFAVVVWDEDRRELCCARDVIGSRPFYYWSKGSSLVFASELAGMLAHPDVPRRLDRTSAVHHALVLTHDREGTLFEGVRRLLPGTRLVGRPETGLTVERFTRLLPSDVDHASPERWAEALGHEIEQAVVRRLPDDGLVAAHLSGGLDSSAVVAVAAAALARRDRSLEAISFSAPPDAEIDGARPVDAEFVSAVRDRTDVEVTYPPVALLSFEDVFREAAPGMMPPPFSTSAVHREAARRGVHTVLSGWGGDEGASFNGRSHLAELLTRGRLLSVARDLRALHDVGTAPRPIRFLCARGLVPLVPDSAMWWYGVARKNPLIDRGRASVLHDDVVEAAGVGPLLRHPLRTRRTTLETQRRLLENGHLVGRVEAWSADARRFGIDYAHPLLDRRVIAVALAAPSGLFLRNGRPRWLFSQAMHPHLPTEVTWRTDKKDSFVQQRMAAASLDVHVPWILHRVQAMIDGGNDLGAMVDLGHLRAVVGAITPEDARRPDGIRTQLTLFALLQVAQLDAFCRHNRISTSR